MLDLQVTGMQKGMHKASYLVPSTSETQVKTNTDYTYWKSQRSTDHCNGVIFSHIHVRQIYNTYGSYSGVNDPPLTIASPDQVRSKLAVLLYFAAKPNNDRQFLNSPGFLWHRGQLRWGAVS